MKRFWKREDVAVTIKLGYSPCPNDTFIFYALVHGKIPLGELVIQEELYDVETLNQKALRGELDVTKVSFHAYGLMRDRYFLLRAGSALGRGCGPLLVSSSAPPPEELRGRKIAVPGKLTTAFLLLQLYDPALSGRVIEMPFDKIMAAVRDGIADAGLVIHESRFTYPSYGLVKLVDLGEWWEGETGLPLPLGCIIVQKRLGRGLAQEIDARIKASIEYAFSHKEETKDYIRAHSRELEDRVIEQHIGLYVNDYSVDIGKEGLAAVRELFNRAELQGVIPEGVGEPALP